MFTPYKINYLFDSAGNWIAFRKGIYVFDLKSNWVGYTPWKDSEVYTPDGIYLGTIVWGNRFYRHLQHSDRGEPEIVSEPFFPGIFPPPAYPGRAPLPNWASDLDFSEQEIDF